MLTPGRTLSFWFYPDATGDPGRDRNARTTQFACLLFAAAIGIAVTLDIISREPIPAPMVSAVLVVLCAASVLNRAGQSMWAGRIVVLALLLCAVLRVVHANDGFRSHAMLMFPGILLLSVMLLDRASYLTTAVMVMLIVAVLGVAEKRGFFGAMPLVRTPTNYESIFLVDLTLLAFSLIGSRIVRDAQRNVGDLHVSISQLSTANIELRKTAEALRRSEGRWNAALENLAVAIVIATDTEQVIYRNPAARAMHGFTTGQEGTGPLLEMTSIFQLWTPEGQPVPFDEWPMRRMKQGKPVNHLELRLRRPDQGWEKIVSYSGAMVESAIGERLLFVSAQDLTDQRKIEQSLRETEERLARAQNAARVGVWDCDLRTNITVFSGEYARLYGLQPDHPPLPHEEWLRLVHPSDRQRVEMLLQESIERSHAWDVEFRVAWPDGSTHWLLGKGEVLLDESGAAVRMTGVNLDITDRKQAEARLHESEQHLKKAERLAHIGHWAWDIRSNRVSGSEEMYRIFGKPLDYVPSYSGFLEDLMPPDRERLQNLIQDSLTRNVGHSIEYQIAHPNGDVRTISCIWEVLPDDDGSPVRIFGTCQDITEARLIQNESFARQKLESVGTLAGGIAHDFNNLLGAVMAQAELAQAELTAGWNPEGELKTIRDLAMRGSQIVRELMIYAGKESEGIGLVDVSQIVEEMLELLKVSLSKHATLETDIGQHPATIRASAAQISQLVMNLVTNASEALGDRDGVIRIATRRLTIGHDSRETERLTEGEYVQLKVSDTGCGISPGMQARLFDPFFSTKSPGRGLGLAVVHGIVRSIGGAIHLSSEPGHGTTFEILLPCAEATALATEEPVSSAEPSRSCRKCTVLVVEDEDLLRQGVVKMLRRHEFEVLEAANGSVAIEMLRAAGSNIDVILLDLTIPGPSSDEVVTEAAKVRPDIRVIMTSAYSEEKVASELRASQIIRGFIRKPFQIADLVQKLRTNFYS